MDNYCFQSRNISFLLPAFRELKQTYGSTCEKWLGHNSTFTFWFERLKDDRLKLTLEIGPLNVEQRLGNIKTLESLVLQFSPKSKQTTSRYTRLFSKSKLITNWDDEETLYVNGRVVQ
ncbi:hypothetical protein [Neobacillus vireti]|uniref:Uncharacterized protein n=1 Tax=Neobacillus vireti LMG 21834 TaxID=1131730 RepID=A0AB94IPW5_9BACI|nr:hypothetical protein [Neobacillus vireti]ETI69052.1 hypothetical protein BAVI_09831 [Neobacillus vireti LMG 21834]KLT15669.1 hypothetical protein AA980_20720 [Neobacillus vireti]